MEFIPNNIFININFGITDLKKRIARNGISDYTKKRMVFHPEDMPLLLRNRCCGKERKLHINLGGFFNEGKSNTRLFWRT